MKKTRFSAKIILRKVVFEIRAGMDLRSALQKLEIPSQSVLATCNGKLITDDEIIKPEDVIQLIAVISGG